MRNLLVLLLLLMSVSAFSQETFTLSGYIKDAETGETLIGATVFAPQFDIGTSTNAYGFYTMTLPANEEVLVRYSYIGFQTSEATVTMDGDKTNTIELSSGETLEEIVVTADSKKEELNNTQMSVTKLSTKQAKLLPALFGEVDILKTLQLKPGIQSGGEGTSGLYVRGGSADQNLFILDEATVYNASHLFGFFSTFNSDAVKDLKLYKGGFPAQYGGRLSSVIDVRLNEGNRKKFSGKGGIGLISSRLTLEGPIDEGKGSFIVAGRRTYADLITRQINNANTDNEDFNPIPDYYFYDLNAKANYDIGENDKIFVSGYFGRDVFRFQDNNFDFDFNWGNITTTARWNHQFGPRLFMNTTATFSDYDYTIENNFGDFAFQLGSGIQDQALKTDLSFSPNNQHLLQFGISGVRHEFDVLRFNAGSSDGSVNFEQGSTYDAGEFGMYINDEFEVNEKLKLNGGLRLSAFVNGEDYYAIEPRFSMKYSLNENVSMKASYARMAQYIHLISGSGVSLPTDVWYPSDENVGPQKSDQVAVGINWAIGDKWIFSNEVYYKWLYDQIDLKNNANLFAEQITDEFVYGEGYSYGNEIYLERTQGKLTGWVGYTLAWSWREFPDIRNTRFPYRYDRRHDVSVVLLYELSDKWNFTGSWVYSTGNAVSIPEGYLLVQDVEGVDLRFVPVYSERNSFRMPAFHRMDLGIVRTFNPKWGKSDLTFSVYNAYDRRNPFFIYIEDNREEILADGDLSDFGDLRFEARQVSLFPIIPSFTFNFEF